MHDSNQRLRIYCRAPAEEAVDGRRPVPLSSRADEVHQAGDSRRPGMPIT